MDRMLPTQRGPWCTARAENYLSASRLTDAERACETTESLQERCEQTALRAWGVAVPRSVARPGVASHPSPVTRVQDDKGPSELAF